MDAILTQDWSVAPEGHTTFHHRAGDVLTGRAAEMAMEAGVARAPVKETKVEPPLEAKRGRRK